MIYGEYLNMINRGKQVTEKDLVGLKENNETSFLINFVFHAHPNSTKTSQGNRCDVKTERNNLTYLLFEGCIVRVNNVTGRMKMFQLTSK